MYQFFATVWGENRPGLYGELRFIRRDDGNGRVLQLFYPVTTQGLRDATDEIAKLNVQGWDAYYGVLPRIRRSGTAEDVYQGMNILWADLDSKSFGEDGTQDSKEAALAALRKPVLQPQIIVDSGGGYHAYWLLDREMDLEWGSLVMKGIAKQVNGDHVSDAPRVLRVPGSLNWKRESPRPARVLRFDIVGPFYRPADFSDYLEYSQPKQRTTSQVYDRQDLPDWLIQLCQQGAPKGQRSEAAFKAALWLAKYGQTDDEIRLMFALTPNGIGAKYAERGDNWLNRTIENARAATSQRRPGSTLTR